VILCSGDVIIRTNQEVFLAFDAYDRLQLGEARLAVVREHDCPATADRALGDHPFAVFICEECFDESPIFEMFACPY
jgi:hypothetical protein